MLKNFPPCLLISDSYENEKWMRDSTVADPGISEPGAQCKICGLGLFWCPLTQKLFFVVIVESKININVCWLHGYFMHVMQSKLT